MWKRGCWGDVWSHHVSSLGRWGMSSCACLRRCSGRWTAFPSLVWYPVDISHGILSCHARMKSDVWVKSAVCWSQVRKSSQGVLKPGSRTRMFWLMAPFQLGIFCDCWALWHGERPLAASVKTAWRKPSFKCVRVITLFFNINSS